MKTHTSQGDVRWGCWTNVREILRCAQDDSHVPGWQLFVILSAAKDLTLSWIITKGGASDKPMAYMPGYPGGLKSSLEERQVDQVKIQRDNQTSDNTGHNRRNAMVHQDAHQITSSCEEH